MQTIIFVCFKCVLSSTLYNELIANGAGHLVVCILEVKSNAGY